ncbi:MAG: hypothetical protein AAF387_07660 [Pseudomonadota bacterium]
MPLRLVSLLVVVGLALALSYTVIHKAQGFRFSTIPSLQEFQPPTFWGRNAFVPDWQAGEQNDLRATRHFFDSWAGQLSERPQVEHVGQSVNPNARVIVRSIPHWLEVRPFRDLSGEMPEGNPQKFAALGESEAYAFAIRSLDANLDITAQLEPWRKDGNAVAPLNVSFRLMLPYLARSKSGKRDTTQIVKPMVLVASDENSWLFPKSYTMVIVADVHISVGQEPGLYATKFVLRNRDRELFSLPIRLEVLPFELQVNDFHAGAFGTAYDLWQGGFTGYYPEMIEIDSRYGFNIAGGFFNKGNEIPFTFNPNGRLIVDRANPKFKKFDQTMRNLKKFGMGDVLFWNWGGSGKYQQFLNVLKGAGITAPFDTAEGRQKFAELLQAIKAVERVRNWPEIVINPFDEALKDQDATRAVVSAIPHVKAESPDTRLYMTEWRPNYTRHYQSSGKHLAGKHRPREAEYLKLRMSGEQPVFNFAVIGSNVLSEASRQLQDQLGGEYWNYTGAWSITDTTQFGLGFRPWITRSETVLIWANYKGDLFNEGWTVHHALPFDKHGRKNRNTRGPVLAGAQAYAVREGIDDRKYIETLRYHAWRTGSETDWGFLASLSKRARQILENPESVGGVDNIPGRLVKGANLLSMRAEIKNRILTLLDQPTVH